RGRGDAARLRADQDPATARPRVPRTHRRGDAPVARCRRGAGPRGPALPDTPSEGRRLMTTGASQPEPLQVLREYRNLAPWNLRDLSALVGAVLDASAITPINAAARAHPSERTIRFYVTKGLVSPPEGRGTAATYSYRHFLQLLWIKLRQMEGATLATITKEMQDQTGDVLERRAAQALGASLLVPDRLQVRSRGAPPRGKSRRALTAWIARDAERDAEVPSSWRRIPVGRGLELHIETGHPLARLGPDETALAETIRQ